jgi:hypothetical protein
MPLIGVEAGAAAAVAWGAAAIITAYLADRIGFALTPLPILMLSLAAAIACWLRLRRHAIPDRAALTAFLTIVVGTFAWLMWRARPDFLPAGSGSDLTHHLSLLAYIEQHGRLPRDAAPGVYLGEMIDYTPGFHLLTVLVARSLHRDALHVVHGVVALTVAVKAGLVFLIARRLMPDEVRPLPFAIAAVLLLWLPYTFFIGSFMEQSFLPQVVAELFAVAMWWTIVEWRERPSPTSVALFALYGAATFLTWPIWLGPLVLSMMAAMALQRGLAWRARAQHLALALIPIAALAAIYTATRIAYGFDMIHAVGFVVRPSPQTMTWPFFILAIAGVVYAALQRRARLAAIFAAAIAVQAVVLVEPGLRGADVPYLSLKMAYLAIYPLSVAAAAFLARLWRVPSFVERRNAWAPVAAIAIGVALSVAREPRPAPVVTESVLRAGEWARTRVAPACVDYLVADGYTGYWLHLAVLGNPRATGRTLDDDTFEPQKAIVRWIVAAGLPYAIADRFDALPRDIRTNVDVLARFGPTAVIKRRGTSACDSTAQRLPGPQRH